LKLRQVAETAASNLKISASTGKGTFFKLLFEENCFNWDGTAAAKTVSHAGRMGIGARADFFDRLGQGTGGSAKGSVGLGPGGGSGAFDVRRALAISDARGVALLRRLAGSKNVTPSFSTFVF
jgi:hypothetical protein